MKPNRSFKLASMLEGGFFERTAVEVGRDLIGVELLCNGVGGLIVETEAYLNGDPASHSYRGQTPRNRSMFGPPGCAYVYHIYGMHWCLNAVCLPGSAVLIRALQPTTGLAAMRRRRRVDDIRLFCSGPGRLCQALGIDGRHDGLRLSNPPFELKQANKGLSLVTGTRIGITRAIDEPWRFGLRGSEFVSRKF